jgi:voltage-gated sodium channel type X alpha
LIDIIVTNSLPEKQLGSGAITAFRAFRLMRVFKLAEQWRRLQSLLNIIMQSLRDISSFSVLLLLLIFIYVMIGLELFSNSILQTSAGEIISADDA